jgi:hypothetical protein
MSAWDAHYQVDDKESQTKELLEMFAKHLHVRHRMDAKQIAAIMKDPPIRTES